METRLVNNSVQLVSYMNSVGVLWLIVTISRLQELNHANWTHHPTHYCTASAFPVSNRINALRNNM